MNNKNVLILFFILALTMPAATLSAQAGNENISFSTGNFFMRANRPTNIVKVIDGTPYVDGKEFHKAKIKGYSEALPNLRYNAYADEMEFMVDSTLYYANKEHNSEIIFPSLNKVYQMKRYKIDNREHFGYLVLLADLNQYQLYKREKVELLPGEKSPSAFGKDANDYYAKQKDLYLIAQGQNYSKTPKNIKEAAVLFNEDSKVIQTYLKKNKLQFGKEADLIKIVRHFDSIKSSRTK